jgi:hypothetical protein
MAFPLPCCSERASSMSAEECTAHWDSWPWWTVRPAAGFDLKRDNPEMEGAK